MEMDFQEFQRKEWEEVGKFNKRLWIWTLKDRNHATVTSLVHILLLLMGLIFLFYPFLLLVSK